MTFSTLMVHIDLIESNDARLQIAAELAEQFDAKVIGIAAGNPQPAYFPGGGFAQGLVAQLRSEIKEHLERAEDRFRSAMKQRVRDIEWRSAMMSPIEYVLSESRSADLIIAGINRDGTAALDPLRRLDPSDLVMLAGRPLFAVPPEADHLGLSRAVVAWKDTREARRAVADALPLLHKVKEVAVVEVIEEETGQLAHARVDDVAAWLRRHGIEAFGRVFHTAGDQQVDKIWQYGADFIVAGAYGHARMREWIFGGFTHALLTRSRQCSFLAH